MTDPEELDFDHDAQQESLLDEPEQDEEDAANDDDDDVIDRADDVAMSTEGEPDELDEPDDKPADGPPKEAKRKRGKGRRVTERSTRVNKAATSGGAADGGGAATPAVDTIDVDRTVRYVKLGELVHEHPHWQNPRSHTGLDDVSITALATSVGEGSRYSDAGVLAGVSVPLSVLPVRGPNGSTVQLIIDGQRRYLAAKRACGDDAWVPIIWIEPEPVEWSATESHRYLCFALESEATRAGLGSYERVEAAAKLRGQRNPDTGAEYTLARIGALVGRSETWCSRMLKAHATAAPKVIAAWRRGELTDEQFKDAAAASPAAAAKVVEAAAAAKESGGKRGEVRAAAKEARAKAESHAAKEERAKPAKGDDKQTEMPRVAPGAPPHRVVVETILRDAERVHPTAEICKGILLGIQWASGRIDAADLPASWRKYMTRLTKP